MNGKLISFVICEAAKAKKNKAEAFQVTPAKSAPRYFETSVPEQFVMGGEKISLLEKDAQLAFKKYEPDILIAEVTCPVSDIFADDIFELKEKAIEAAREYLKKRGGREVEEWSEEYSIYAVSGYAEDPEHFLSHKNRIAALLKSEKLPLDEREVEYTLSTQLKYANNDLVIVDWDGAFIFDPDGDYESAIELFELANLQLLRYRMLERQLDGRLHKVAEMLKSSPVKTKFLFRAAEIDQSLKDIMLVRSSSISEFQDLERGIRLIGDWYSARLYELVAKKFKIEEWRRIVKEKLDAIEDIYSIAAENFTISWERRGRIIEMAGWYILLVGWLALLIADIYFYGK